MSSTNSNTDDKESLSLRETFRILFKASKGFWLVNFVNFGDGVAYFGILALLTRFLGTQLGMSDQLTGVTVSMYMGLVTLFMFGGGFVSDKLGVRRALSWSLLVIGIGRIFLSGAPIGGESALAGVLAWFGLFLMAAGTGVLQPALYAGIKEYTDPRTATIGFGLLYSIMNLGIVAEHFISPFIRTGETFMTVGATEIVGLGWGIDGVFWFCTFVTGLMLVIHMSLFTKKVEASDRVVKEAPKIRTAHLSFMDRLRDLPFFDKRFMFFIFALLPVRTLFAHQWLTMPDYVFRAYPDYVGAKFEWINGLNPLIIVIFVPLIAAFTRKAKVIDMMIVGTVITAATTFILVPGPNLNMLITYLIFFSLGEAVWSSRFLEYVADLAPAGKVGAYMGLAGIPWFLAKFTTGFYSGAMLERFVPASGAQDTGTLWLIYGIIASTSPIILILSRNWINRSEAVARPMGGTMVEAEQPA